MSSSVHTVNVPLGERDYDILIGASLYIAHREHSLARQRRRQVPAANAEAPI